MKKKLFSLLLAVVLVIGTTSGAFACTGVYVGNQLSQNGSTYVGRSEDVGDLYGKVFSTVPAKDHPAGSIYQDSYGFSMPYPAHTYAYNFVRDSYAYEEGMKDENGNDCGEPYGAAGVNEKGVSISATVSTNYNSQAEAADPLLDTGICEISITSLVLGSAATAREGVQFLANIIDTYGSGECNAIVISDANESWYMEIVSGHQYAAIKLPQDKIALNPNIMLLGEIDVNDTENVITSPNLVKTAQDNGFYRTGESGKFHVSKSYAIPTSGKGQYTRYYQGVYYIDPEAAAKIDVDKINNNDNPLSLMLNSPKKLSTLDVLRYLAYRGEGSALDSNKDTRIYPIGNKRQSECHVFEIRQGMPSDLATIEWLAMADAEFSVYLPYYSALITDTHEAYHVEGKKFVENSINWNFQSINNLCDTNREKFDVNNIKAYFEQYQNSLIEQQKAIDENMRLVYNYDPALAKEKATALGNALATQLLSMSSSVLNELQHYIGAGDFTEPFVPTMMTENVMPEYNFEIVGGTGITKDDQNKDDTDKKDTIDESSKGQNTPANVDKTKVKEVSSGEKAPKTGDSANLFTWFTVLVLAFGTAGVVYRKKHNQ